MGVTPPSSQQHVSKPAGAVTAGEDARPVRVYWVLLIIVTVLLSLPIWTVRYPPLVDYPNHLARMNILAHYGDVEAYRTNYDRRIEPLPNLAMDMVVPFLAKVFEINVAGKIFLTLAVLLFTLGCHLLGTAIHGHPSYRALVCAFSIYNSMLFYGFLNYIFGLGVFLVTLALWLKYRGRWSPSKLVLVSLLTLAAYLSHLSAYVFIGAALVTITFFDYVSARRITREMVYGLLPLLPSLLVFLFYTKGSSETREIYWNGPYKKVVALSSAILGYNYTLDIALALIITAALALVFFFRTRLAVRRDVFAAGCVFGALFLFCPEGLLQTSSADARFVLPALILIAMSVKLEVGRQVGGLALTFILLVLSVRLVSIWRVWGGLGKKIESQVELFNRFEDGARVYPIIFLPLDARASKFERPAYVHTFHYSTVYRHTFSPALLAIQGVHPITYKREPVYFHDYHDRQPPPEAVDWKVIIDNYDYIWCCKVDADYERYLKGLFEIEAESDGCMIFNLGKKKSSALPAPST